MADLIERFSPEDHERFRRAPCFICGFNGPGYYQPNTHLCAARFHATEADTIASLRSRLAEVEYQRDYAAGKEQDVTDTVKRIWVALGNPDYDSLNGMTVSEIVADWKARAEAAEARAGRMEKALREAREELTSWILCESAKPLAEHEILHTIDAALTEEKP